MTCGNPGKKAKKASVATRPTRNAAIPARRRRIFNPWSESCLFCCSIMNNSLRDVVTLTHTSHSVDVEVGARLAITRQSLRRVVPHRVDLALAVRLAARCAVGPVVGVGIRE